MLTAIGHKTVVELSGKDVGSFLQGLITLDMDSLSQTGAAYGALLSPQGKLIVDFFLTHVDHNDQKNLLMVMDESRVSDITQRLNMYKLRADVTITHRPDLAVAHSFVSEPKGTNQWTMFADPRLHNSGWWAIAPKTEVETFALPDLTAFDAGRIERGLTDGSRDWIVNKTLPLEIWADKTGGVDFQKGCYVGQEVTARTHYRDAIKKRLMIASSVLEDPIPPETPIMANDVDIGITLSAHGPKGLAIVRMAQWEQHIDNGYAILVGDIPITLDFPHYAQS